MKKSKRVLLFLLILCLTMGAGWLRWRQGVAYTQEEMLKLVRRMEKIEPFYTLTVLGDYEDWTGHRLLCLEAGGEGYSSQYYAVRFHSSGKAWAYEGNHLLLERGMALYSLSWDGDYIFISGNPNLKAIWLDLADRGEQTVPVDRTPFCYRLELDGIDHFRYEFLDGEGNLITRGSLSPYTLSYSRPARANSRPCGLPWRSFPISVE